MWYNFQRCDLQVAQDFIQILTGIPVHISFEYLAI